MRIRVLLISAIVATLLLTGVAYTFYDGGGDRGKVLVDLLMRSMEQLHYDPKIVDDQFSETFFDEYLDNVDFNKQFLTQRDIDNLARFRYRIDDELQNGTFEFFELSYNIFDRRRNEARQYIKEITRQPFDFERDESYQSDTEDTPFAKDETELRDRWRRELKYRTLLRLHNAIEQQEEAQEEGEEAEVKSMTQLEREAREKTRENYLEYLDRISREDINDYRSQYLNTVANIYDPHTGYFPPKDKEDFDIQLSGQFEGIGASLREDGGYIKVVKIVPGSASSRQGDLQANDKILKVAQGSDTEAIDAVGMDIDDVVKMIRGPKGSEVVLTVRKPDGSIQEIPIVRDVVVLEETYAKSAILRDGDGGRGIGYIKLPSFYADFRNRNGRNSATDVAKEVEKLEQENVEGIILDLRFNGGGSLSDVVEMGGLFVDRGPMVQVKYRDRDPQVLRDRDPSVQYDGKLIIMVNSYSASASEIMAAAMQDYDRALIVGSPSTFGKGTVQRFVNLDEFVRGGSEVKPLGQIKLTTQKFYRINGDATQLKGVVPHIILPDAYSLIDVGEKDYAHSMAWDEIEPVQYQTWSQPVSRQLPTLRRKSGQRTAESQTFQLIQENAKRYKRRQSRNTYPLSLSAFQARQERIQQESKRYKNIRKTIEDMEVAFIEADLDHINEEESRQDRYQKWRSNLRKDPHLYEALQIMQDMQ